MITPQRPAPGDVPVLRRIWRDAFGDTDEGIDAFFSYWYSPETALCIRGADGPCSMGFLLPCGELVTDAGRIPCAQIYALATDRRFRGRGFAASVTAGLSALARRLDIGVAVLHPASAELFGYYGRNTAMRAAFYAKTLEFTAGSDTDVTATAVTPGEYGALRERFLDGTPHIALSLRAIAYAEILGGRLLRFDRGGETIGCGADCAGGCLEELLCAPELEPGCAAAAGAASAVCPGGVEPFGMADAPVGAGAWYGLFFG